MKKTMFRVNKLGFVNDKTIELVEVLKETEKTVVIEASWGRGTLREHKHCQYYAYFETLPEAQDYLLELWKNRVVYAEAELRSNQKDFEKAKALVRGVGE